MKYIKYILLQSIFFTTLNLFALTDDEKSLFISIENKDSQNVSSLLKNSTNININVLDDEGYTPLHRAVYNEDVNTVLELLKYTNINVDSKLDMKVNVNGWYLGGATPLILSSFLGNDKIVNILIENNADVKAKDSIDGGMSIHLASANGRNDVIASLLKKDPTLINLKDDKGNTPLHWAAMKDKTETIKLLIANGADIEAVDVDNWTALHYASAFASLDSVNALLESGANKEAKTKDDSTPAYYAKNEEIMNVLALDSLSTTTNENITEVIDENTITLSNTQIDDKNTSSDDEVNLTDKQLELLVAISNNDIIAVNNLLREGISANFKYEEGYSPLHLAVLNDNIDILKMLLEQKNIDKEIKLNKDAYLVDYNWFVGEYTPLLLASLIGNVEAVEILIDSGANLYAKDSVDGAEAIHIASANGRDDVVRVLLNRDKRLVNVRDDDRTTFGLETPLHWAASNNLYSTVVLLTEYKSDLKAKNTIGNTPLHHAINANADSKLIKYLIDKDNTLLTIKNKKGKTPMDIAVSNGNTEIIALLNSYDSSSSSPVSFKNINRGFDINSIRSSLLEYRSKQDLSKKWWVNN